MAIKKTHPDDEQSAGNGVFIEPTRSDHGLNGLPKIAAGKVWVADAPVVGGDVIDFRQMWINNKKAIRARDKNDGSMNRVLSWNSRKQQ